MALIQVSIIEPVGAKKTVAEVPDNVTTQRLVRALVERMKLPTVSGDGRRISYRLSRTQDNKGIELQPEQTLADAGVRTNDALLLYVEPVNNEPNSSSYLGSDSTEKDWQDIKQTIEALQISLHANNVPLAVHVLESLEHKVASVGPVCVTIKEAIPYEFGKNFFRKELAVRASDLFHLEEYRGEQDKWFSITSGLVGMVFGIIINWVTSDPLTITRVSLVLIAVFMVLAGLSGITAFHFQRLAEKWKRDFWNDPDNALEVSQLDNPNASTTNSTQQPADQPAANKPVG